MNLHLMNADISVHSLILSEIWKTSRRTSGGDMAATDFKTDIKDNGKEYVLEAELPGFKKEDIHVDIEDGYMTISAERSNETEKKDDKGNFVRRERSYGSFSRSFDVSSVKTEDITGEYKDGVLTLTMPKKEENVPTSRRIEIG